ncbi:MAG: MBOAT family O-acyltransferase [Lachnospiraceae bacterium]
MLFNSYIFIFLFLPITLIGYYSCNRLHRYKLAQIWLVLMSLWFYGYFNPSYLAIMLSSIVINYLVYRMMATRQDIAWRKIVLAVGLLFNVGLIFYFKYYDFFVENINAVFSTDLVLKHILLPLGISFFTFQQISFIVDVYRGEVGEYSFVEYALFVTFFPQLIAGPIVTHAEIIPQFQEEHRKRLDVALCSKGAVLFILGLFKKVIIADTFGQAVNWGYENIAILDSTNAILVMLFYAMQLYFDFSGYCDMARGIGYFFGIEIPINFNSPYKAVNIVDFWKRWHITLNRFMTQYVYIPLGGNRKGVFRTYLNLFAIFLVSGIWHGAGWTYIIWGVMHGVAYILTRMSMKWLNKIPTLITGAVTFLFFNISIIYFRAQSVWQANQMISNITKWQFGPIQKDLAKHFNLDEFWYILKILHLDTGTYSQVYLCIAFLIGALFTVFCCKNASEIAQRFHPKAWNAVLLACLLAWCVASFSGVSTFLYFNF